MPTSDPGPAPDLSFPIRYQVFTEAAYNGEFSGSGTLSLRTAGPVCTFAGRRRLPFWRGRMMTVEFGADDISNVTVRGRMIRFDAAKGAAGPGPRAFLFYCADAATAAQVAPSCRSARTPIMWRPRTSPRGSRP